MMGLGRGLTVSGSAKASWIGPRVSTSTPCCVSCARAFVAPRNPSKRPRSPCSSTTRCFFICVLDEVRNPVQHVNGSFGGDFPQSAQIDSLPLAANILRGILIVRPFEVEFVPASEDAFDLFLVPRLVGHLVLQVHLEPDR